jgi:hypothetical protein
MYQLSRIYCGFVIRVEESYPDDTGNPHIHWRQNLTSYAKKLQCLMTSIIWSYFFHTLTNAFKVSDFKKFQLQKICTPKVSYLLSKI